MKQGWTLAEIDEADFFFLIELLTAQGKEKVRYMDDDF
jgi:hypothetical protein